MGEPPGGTCTPACSGTNLRDVHVKRLPTRTESFPVGWAASQRAALEGEGKQRAPRPILMPPRRGGKTLFSVPRCRGAEFLMRRKGKGKTSGGENGQPDTVWLVAGKIRKANDSCRGLSCSTHTSKPCRRSLESPLLSNC